MGLVRDTIAEAEAEANGPDDAARGAAESGDSPEDLFLEPFNTEHIKIDAENADRILGLAVVISNLFG